VLGVDTDVVAPDGTILGKRPTGGCRRILRILSGQTHQVFTGIALLESTRAVRLSGGRRGLSDRVTFAELPDAAIASYVGDRRPAG